MRKTSLAVHAQSGAVSAALLGLTGLAGFAAGAVVVGLLALDQRMATPAAGAHATVTASPPWQAAAPPDPVSSRDWSASQPGSAWPYESAARPKADAPGKDRPDRLGGPEGWTPEPSLIGP